MSFLQQPCLVHGIRILLILVPYSLILSPDLMHPRDLITSISMLPDLLVTPAKPDAMYGQMYYFLV
jgi:hypothetical protein